MTPTEALAQALERSGIAVDIRDWWACDEAATSILAALPPGWRLVGPDEVTVTEALREVWESVPATYDDDDPMVRRHARAINAIPAILAALSADKEEQK